MTYQFKIQIKGITKPPVWRRVLVPDTYTFLQFHQVIQYAFNWSDYHLFEFIDKMYDMNVRISEVNEEDDWYYPVKTQDAAKVKLKSNFGKDVTIATTYKDVFNNQKGFAIGASYVPVENLLASVKYFDGKDIDSDTDADRFYLNLDFFY